MKKMILKRITTSTTSKGFKGWKPGKKFKIPDAVWTYPTNTERPKGKLGILIDRGRWLDFGEKRFEFKKFNQPAKPFEDAYGFIKALENRGFKILGSGAFSTVLGKPGKDRVIKVIRRPDGWIDYVHWASKKENSFSPKVFSYKKIKGRKKDFSVSIMERLEYTFGHAPKDHALKVLPELMWSAKDNPMAATFVDTLAPGLNKFMVELHKEFKDERLDLHDGNMMVRKDGSFVLVDPVCGGQRTDYGRLKAGDFSPAIQINLITYDRFLLIESSYRFRSQCIRKPG